MLRHHWLSQSLRKKMLLWLLLPMLALIAIDSSILFRVGMHFQRSEFDHELSDTAYDISQLVSSPANIRGSLELSDDLREAILSAQDDKMYYSIINLKGEIIAGDHVLKLALLTNAEEDGSPYFVNMPVANEPARVAVLFTTIVVHGKLQPVIIQVAETLNKRDQLSKNILIAIIVPQLFLLLTASLLIWFGTGRGLLPLSELQYALAQRMPRDLSPVKLSSVPTEMQVLLDSVNFLLLKLNNVLESQNRFVADAAHQLRTPLAGMQAQIELIQNETDPAEIKQGLKRVTNSVHQLSHLVSQLLMLARNQPEVVRAIDLVEVDIKHLAQEVTIESVPTAFQQNIDLGFESDVDEAWIEGEPKRLREMLHNLLDNAIRYSGAGSKVTVKVLANADRVTLSVEDNGPGIPVSEHERVFERFYRIIGTKQEGSGLGLAIVLEIAQIHKAEVKVEQPEHGKGTRINVVFHELGESSLVSSPLHDRLV
jgi:two-component system sensor histidine kinase TctE